MKPVSFFGLAFLLVASGCATVADAPEAEPGTPVALVFGWEPGMQASVVSTRTRQRTGASNLENSMTSLYTLRVDSAGEELRVHFDDLEVEVGGKRAPAAEAIQFIAQMGDLAPDYRVTTHGEFLGLHDMPAFQQRLETLLTGMIPPKTQEALGPMMEMLTSEAFLNTRAAEQWNAIVGTWADAELALGSAYEAQIREPVPVVPGTEVMMNYTFEVKELVSCERGGTRRECAALEMHSIADPEDTAKMIEAIIDRIAGQALTEQPVITSLDMDNTLQVVTEPNGLIPHQYKLIKNLRATVRIGDREREMVQVDTTEAAYSYP